MPETPGPQAHRPLRHRTRPRRGRDGRRLRGQRHAAAPQGRDQDHPQERARLEFRQGILDALRARGAGGGAPEPSQHRAGVRLRRGGRCRLHRHGAGARARAEDLLRREGALRAEGDRAHRGRAVRGAALRPRGRHRPPRHQAGQRHDRRAGAGQAHRLRRRAHCRPGPHRLGQDAGRHGGRHAGLHVARADPGPHPRPAQRHFFRGRDPLRVPLRQQAVHGRGRLGDRQEDPQRGARAALQPQPRAVAAVRRGGR